MVLMVCQRVPAVGCRLSRRSHSMLAHSRPRDAVVMFCVLYAYVLCCCLQGVAMTAGTVPYRPIRPSVWHDGCTVRASKASKGSPLACLRTVRSPGVGMPILLTLLHST